MTDMPFSCACGNVHGRMQDVGPDKGDFVYCHCTDCQAFARYLDAEGRVLEQAEGTALYQTRCARLAFGGGKDRLASLHLTDLPTLRWYAACCRTPLFNTYKNGRIPYTTILLANVSPDDRALLGPPKGHLHLKDARGYTDGLKSLSMAALLRSFFGRLVRDFLSGDRRRNALFDADTLEPIASPHRLNAAERTVAYSEIA